MDTPLEALESELSQLLQGELVAQGCELFQIRVRRMGSRLVVSLVIDHPEGGISLSECARWNERVGELIDARGLVPGSYVLEVESPGADWPLREERDYRRLRGRPVRIAYRSEGAVRTEVRRIARVEGGILYLEASRQLPALELPLGAVVSARAEIRTGHLKD
jgi:ribosome maturation factor RimP